MEHEYPPRFAQGFGSLVLAVALIAFLVGLPIVGWVLSGAVAALQTVLATTGFCLGLAFLELPALLPALVGAQPGHPLVDPRRALAEDAPPLQLIRATYAAKPPGSGPSRAAPGRRSERPNFGRMSPGHALMPGRATCAASRAFGRA